MQDRRARSSKAAAEHRQAPARRTGGPGRPSIFSDALASLICERISSGQSLREICRTKGMPHLDTVRQWLIGKPEFSAQYARAREEQADTLADEVVAIADSVAREKSGTKVQAARLRVDARKWKASKLRPKVYGEKLELGGDVDVNHKSAAPLDWDGIEARIDARLRSRKRARPAGERK
jgi:hypothetical protein